MLGKYTKTIYVTLHYNRDRKNNLIKTLLKLQNVNIHTDLRHGKALTRW